MARLPTPGQDTGSWGSILNDFLHVSHTDTGHLKDASVTATALAPGSVTANILGDSTVLSTHLATTGSPTSGQVLSFDGNDLIWTTPSSAPVTSVAGRTGVVTLTKVDVGLGNVDNTADANKPISAAAQTALDLKLTASNNLDDIADAATARTNLGLGSAATMTPASLASDSAIKNSYTSRRQGLARDFVAAATIPHDSTAISPLTPTITDSRSVTAPVSFTGVRIKPIPAPGTTWVDIARDPHFEIIGAAENIISTNSSSDMCRPLHLTGGASQAARWRPRWRFWHTGRHIGFYWRSPGNNLTYRLYVNGLPIGSTSFQSLAGVSSATRGVLEFDFGSFGTRLMEMEIVDPEFGGVYIEPTGSITRPTDSRLLMVGSGDSHTGGANGVNHADTWVRIAADILHCDWANQGIGGSGFLNVSGAGTTAPEFRTRVAPDIVTLQPDMVIHCGGWNDFASTSVAIGAEALQVYQALRAALPDAILIAGGPWVNSHNLSTLLDGHDAAMRVAAQAAGFDGYISFRDPLRLKDSTSAWTASTAYAVGDVRVQNGFAQTCIVAHTSTGTFDQTKWRSTAVVTGTGRVGATVGDGNADIVVSSDTVHSTAIGHSIKGAFIAGEVKRIIASIAAGNTWAN